jgi:DNA repair exonuclease SbcCD nuclease subunit
MYFISDAHIREQMYAHRPLIKSDFYRGLTAIACDIIKNGHPTEVVVFTGDNMHFKKVFAKDVELMQQVIRTLSETGHMCFGIQGNHDLNEGVSWIEVCGGFSLNDGKVYHCEEGDLMGMDYTPGDAVFDRLEKVCRDGPECDILCIHQPFKHNCAWDPYALDVDDIPDCVRKIVVSGHVHAPDIRLNSRGIQVASVGATVKSKMGDHEGTYARYTQERGFEHIPTPGQRPQHRWRVRNSDEIEAVTVALGELPKDRPPEEWPIIEVTFVDGCPNDTVPFTPFEDRAHLFYSTDLEQAVETNTEEAMTESLTWEGILPKCTNNQEVLTEVKGLLHDTSGRCLEGLKEKLAKQREELKNALKES